MYAIVIMAKAPFPNKVKTRLIPPLAPYEASRLYYSFLLDKIEQVKCIGEALPFMAYSPRSSEPFFRSIIPADFSVIIQVGKDLGERLTNISHGLFAERAKKVIILDSDTPNLPTDYIREGLARLDEVDVVLGPCEDGGYYLIGMRSFIPEIFSGIPWSTAHVTELTMKKVQTLGLNVSMLPGWYDVDTEKDLKRLMRDIEFPSGNCFFCENTLDFLQKNKPLFTPEEYRNARNG
ncbi:MAG: TIGR04282 family arsenosugar biosynthesis glycosyltransferase [Candidatus Methanoperedens sp.]|nr:TIGR04282 family arsenosugar biosynthesis glycosyltransferase [Candidatus Methanoperedens sp.]